MRTFLHSCTHTYVHTHAHLYLDTETYRHTCIHIVNNSRHFDCCVHLAESSHCSVGVPSQRQLGLAKRESLISAHLRACRNFQMSAYLSFLGGGERGGEGVDVEIL